MSSSLFQVSGAENTIYSQ